jgi:hypothetical protein
MSLQSYLKNASGGRLFPVSGSRLPGFDIRSSCLKAGSPKIFPGNRDLVTGNYSTLITHILYSLKIN